MTTTFSIADAELWKPLPYPAPDQLVAVFSKGPGARAQVDPISGADLLRPEVRLAAQRKRLLRHRGHGKDVEA